MSTMMASSPGPISTKCTVETTGLPTRLSTTTIETTTASSHHTSNMAAMVATAMAVTGNHWSTWGSLRSMLSLAYDTSTSQSWMQWKLYSYCSLPGEFLINSSIRNLKLCPKPLEFKYCSFITSQSFLVMRFIWQNKLLLTGSGFALLIVLASEVVRTTTIATLAS